MQVVWQVAKLFHTDILPANEQTIALNIQ